MRILKSTTALTPIALLMIPGSAYAQLSISTATTTPVRTSTAVNNAPADINITSTGSVTVNAAGGAVTVDSNNAVTNAGTIAQGNADNAVGIDVAAGTSGTITNSNIINVTETFNAPNVDGNAIVDGPIAQATNRAGILLRGAHTGNVVVNGTVTVEGLNSAGVRADGTLTGSLLTGGAIRVRGDGSTAVKTQAVTGNVVIGGQTAVVGRGARAVDIGDDVGGFVRIANTVGQSASFTDDNGATMSLARADLNVGAPTVVVSGNVGAGLIVAAAPTTSTTNPDNDGDGVADNLESTGVINGIGNGPALLIGNANRNTTIGAVASDGHGIVIGGGVNSSSLFSSANSTAIQIGGLGGNVTVTGGMKVTGTVSATTVDSGATAIAINAGSSVPVIDNTGTIRATISSPGQGSAYGVRDLSGTLTTINNSGNILATGTAQDVTYALDLSANTSGVTINQTAPSGTAADAATTTLTKITGNIITGTGNDTINLGAGTIQGTTFLGAGNDSLILTRDAIYGGRVDFGTGTAALSLANTSQFIGTAIFNNQAATITLANTAKFRGDITGGSNLTVNVNGGTLEAAGTADIAFNTLNVASGGTIKINIDTATGTAKKFVVNTANFAAGSQVAATISTLTNAEGSYVVLTANQITGTPSFSSDQTVLPFLFNGTVSVANNQILLNVARKTATQLGLNTSQSAAYSAILAAAVADDQVAESLLGATDQAGLATQFNQLLPDHAGGNFDLLSRGSRLAARHLYDNNAMFDISNIGGWLEPYKWTGSKGQGQTAAYRTSGFGISMGLERQIGDIGRFGLLFNYMSGTNKNQTTQVSEIKASAYEVGGFWRISEGPFYAFARGTVAFGKFDSTRAYVGTDALSTAFGRQIQAKWNGRLYSSTIGASYQLDVTERVSLKPMAVFDYFRLRENGYTETGGAVDSDHDAVDLVVKPRTSSATNVTTTLTGSYRFGNRTREGIPLTIEVEGGRRNVLTSKLGNTAAAFDNGAYFTLTPDKLKSNWLGEVRLLSGGLDYTWQLAGGAEKTEGRPSYHIRFSFGVAF